MYGPPCVDWKGRAVSQETHQADGPEGHAAIADQSRLAGAFREWPEQAFLLVV